MLPELIYTKAESVSTETGSNEHSSWIKTSRMRAELDKETKVLRFFDRNGHLLTEEVLNSRHWTTAVAKSEKAGTAEVSFRLAPGEHLYGSGQYQDGYLNIARLPRKLVQLNTQIAIPFLLSSQGFGLLWHQYGATEINQPANALALKETGSGQSVTVDVTTSAGTQTQNRHAKTFEGDFVAPQEGDYALALNAGRVMTDRWSLTIDNKPVIEFSNGWLPGSTSTLAHFAAGPHHVVVQANADDKPSLQWGLAQQQTSLSSPRRSRHRLHDLCRRGG